MGLSIVSPRYGIPQRLRTVVQQVEGFCHRTKTLSSRHPLLSWKNSKRFMFLLNKGAQLQDVAISKLTPRMYASDGISI
jgi:hypothetical protein